MEIEELKLVEPKHQNATHFFTDYELQQYVRDKLKQFRWDHNKFLCDLAHKMYAAQFRKQNFVKGRKIPGWKIQKSEFLSQGWKM